MGMFRKRPVVIEAKQLTDNSVGECYDFIHGVSSKKPDGRWQDYVSMIQDNGMDIKTLEGTIHASIGDWIIKGVSGEFYPCKPDIFLKTYEEV